MVDDLLKAMQKEKKKSLSQKGKNTNLPLDSRIYKILSFFPLTSEEIYEILDDKAVSMYELVNTLDYFESVNLIIKFEAPVFSGDMAVFYVKTTKR